MNRPGAITSFLVGVFIFLTYGTVFWRMLRSNRGNKPIELGAIALIVFLAFIPLSKLGVPDWLVASWGILVIVLCFATLFFVVQWFYRELRHRSEK